MLEPHLQCQRPHGLQARNHPLGVAEKAKRAKRARLQFEAASAYVAQRFDDSPSQELAIRKRRMLQRLRGPTPKALNVHIFRLLTNDGELILMVKNKSLV
ncbi:hypothetical protein PPTG_09799 [Phytophthora nicotianae INRA-310]|uniref:Uncharacterized protein n=3 Tax=Phytophthora nicotianae TaxID=4792 RepID=W2QBY8_PHYN3|nr:hypothetical protein PPTG_09799 [Phytophthora nicotianae INRA-310]ETI48804.1 hypothetical protein F443_07213 [Phytophthora nicotianae P1569]ETN10703.1 hypothetical protein PPTG_09799 [Phytophthora nicotianae INRA-310]